MQIIINRIYVVAENRQLVVKVKWGTALVITLINIMVFNVWIPAHLVPPASETYVPFQATANLELIPRF